MAENENTVQAESQNTTPNLESRLTSLEIKFDMFMSEMRANVVRQDADMRELRANVNGTTRNMFIAVAVAVGGMLLSVWLK